MLFIFFLVRKIIINSKTAFRLLLFVTVIIGDLRGVLENIYFL
ncbi:hypothetical protein FEM21_11680 [Flavobacterium seoulense]|uniref:Uncharacterized protein n=1 Tax=Flavobacterium seoulense TaxID=1492738 RepID=A0A066WNY1_9FLAO|nr:hypothetical protein FEM21_11680 [Flavobacterium seoulense]